MSNVPKRVQRQRARGWRTPLCGCGCGKPAIYVGRPTRWRNPYVLGKTQVRLPGAEDPTQPRELEGRSGKPNADNVPFYGVNDTTYHTVQLATREQIVTVYREMLTNQHVHTVGEYPWSINLPEFIAPLRGHDLMCWCPLTDAQGNHVPCHADVLLNLANQEQGEDQ